jgi:putative alpha-1,2-mannosidase/Ca2+-binding EF-hand superfamily protein
MQMQFGDLQFYIDRGWCPMWDTQDVFDMSGGLTLEWAFSDWCAAQLALKIGDRNRYEYFIERSKNYRNQWDPSSGFMRPKRRDGSWYERFDPKKWYGFVEGNAWTYTWYVPHDVPGLVELMGGVETFTDMLNYAFETEMPYGFGRAHSGLFDYGNQPSCGMAQLFNHAGKPWLSQYWTRKVSQIAFGGTTPHDGYCGEEDQGQMGALSALMKIGLFSERGACGADPIYDLTAPEFDEVTIQLDPKYYPGKTFKIKTYNNSPENCYSHKAKLNGEPLHNSWIYQRDVAEGGVLELWLCDTPNQQWGKSLAPVQAGGAIEDALWRQYTVPVVSLSQPKQLTANSARPSRMFQRMDGDGNQSVSRDEFIAFWMRAFQRQDQDRDGMLSVEEFGDPIAFKKMDVDGDGGASKADFEVMYLNQFKHIDTDHDGQLSNGEL